MIGNGAEEHMDEDDLLNMSRMSDSRLSHHNLHSNNNKGVDYTWRINARNNARMQDDNPRIVSRNNPLFVGDKKRNNNMYRSHA